MKPDKHTRKLLPAALALAMGVPLESLAQDVLEEIVVTATRRAESLLDAPISVTAITGDELQQRGVLDATGLGDFVPNLTIGTEGARDATYIAIRGVSQNERRNTDDATTPLFVDGATVPRMSGVAAYFYDVERLEVLRGPQGTLYGRNSTTGVVNVITNKPNFDGYSGNIEVGAGNFSSANLQGAFNLPFTDTLAARVAFTYQERDGFFENGPLVEDNNDAEDLGVRAHLLWNASDSTSLLFTADIYDRDAIGNNSLGVACPSDVTCQLGAPLSNGEGDIPLALQTFRPAGEQQSFRDNQDTNFTFQLDHSFDNFDISALVASREHERNYNTGSSYGPTDTINGIVVDGGVRETTVSDSISAELRFTSTGDGPLQWITGLYYLDEEIDGNFMFQPVFIGSPNAGNHLNVNFIDRGLTIESQAVFGNVSYDISDTITARVGVRYTDDEKDKGGNAADPSAGSYFRVWVTETGTIFGPPFRAQVSNPSWSETTYDLGLDFNVGDNGLFYVKYSTGYKAGGFNRGSAGPGSNPMAGVFVLDVYDPETVDAYEIGYKGTFADGRGRINIAGFMNNYDSKVESVVRIINGIPTNTAVNATDVDIVGLEIEASLLYGDSGGRLDFGIGLLDAEYGSFPNLPDPILGGGAVLDISGTTVLNAPERSINFSWIPTVWEFGGGSLTPRIQVGYKSDYTTRPHGLLVDIQDDYSRSNLSLLYESNEGGWFGEIFVRNIEDEIVQSASSCASQAQAGPAIGCTKMFQAPRTAGARVGFRF